MIKGWQNLDLNLIVHYVSQILSIINIYNNNNIYIMFFIIILVREG